MTAFGSGMVDGIVSTDTFIMTLKLAEPRGKPPGSPGCIRIPRTRCNEFNLCKINLIIC